MHVACVRERSVLIRCGNLDEFDGDYRFYSIIAIGIHAEYATSHLCPTTRHAAYHASSSWLRQGFRQIVFKICLRAQRAEISQKYAYVWHLESQIFEKFVDYTLCPRTTLCHQQHRPARQRTDRLNCPICHRTAAARRRLSRRCTEKAGPTSTRHHLVHPPSAAVNASARVRHTRDRTCGAARRRAASDVGRIRSVCVSR